MKKCSICKEEKPETEFHKNGSRKGAPRFRASCKSCTSKSRRNRALNNKDLIYKYLVKHSCINCGETNPVLLEFDHLEDKFKTISQLADNYTWTTVLKEIQKCQILCANCHRFKTAKDFEYYSYIIWIAENE